MNMNLKMKLLAFFICVFTPLFMSIFSWGTGISIDTKLNGYTDNVDNPSFSVESYLQGTFQNEVAEYIESTFIPGGGLTKIYSQIQFSCFKLGNVIIGKDNDLFEENYIYAGLALDEWDFSIENNQTEAQKFVKTLEEVSEKLAINGKELYFYMAATKVDTDYEYIPLKYKNMEKESSIRGSDYIRDLLNQSNINYFISSDILVNKDYPLYYKTGTHWSCTYEQEISHYLIEQLSKVTNKKYANLVLGDIVESEKPFYRDADIYDLLNIWSEIPCKYFQYALSAEQGEQLNVLLQGDSYGSGFVRDLKRVYPHEEIYYIDYSNYIVDGNDNYEYINGEWNTLEIGKYLDNVDIVIIETTEPNLIGYTWGFLDYLNSFLDSYEPTLY